MSQLAVGRGLVPLVAAALLLGSAGPSRGVGRGAAELAELSLEELLDLRVTTASKKSETVTEAPAFTHVITRDQIQRYGYRNLGEALSSLIGFYFSTDLAFDYTGVRGFARLGDYNTRILVLVDGQRMNGPMYDYGVVGEDFPIDMDGIERIEIVKGPGSALWGSNALLAVVNVIPQKGGDIDGVEAGLEYGSYGRFKGYVKGGGKFANGVEAAGMFSGFDLEGDDDILIPGLGAAHDADEETAIRGYLAASREGFELILHAASGRRDDPTGAWATLFDSPYEGSDYSMERFNAQLSYEREILPERNGSIKTRFYHSTYNEEGHFEYDSELLAPAVDPYINHDVAQASWWGSELQLSVDLHPRVSLITGFEYQDTYEASFHNWDIPFGTAVDTRSEHSIASGYAQAYVEIFEFLHLTLGGRVDDYTNDHDGSHWSPRTAVILTPREGTALKALYGRAFRHPNAYERDYDDGGAYNLANPALQPETITTWELIWDQRLFGSTRLITSLYQYEIEDIITSVDVGGPFQFQNTGKVKSRGIEVMLETRLANGSGGHLGFSALRAEDAATGAWINNSPKYLGNLGISSPLLTDRLIVTTEVQAVGGRKTLAGTQTSPTFNTNLILRFTPFESIRATLGIYNLFDERQSVPGALEHFDNGTASLPLRGTSIRAQLVGRF